MEVATAARGAKHAIIVQDGGGGHQMNRPRDMGLFKYIISKYSKQATKNHRKGISTKFDELKANTERQSAHRSEYCHETHVPRDHRVRGGYHAGTNVSPNVRNHESRDGYHRSCCLYVVQAIRATDSNT